MAVFDESQQKLVTRIVYDGPGFAGKTTNLRRLVEGFSAARRGELKAPGPRQERTPFFDWLDLEAGLIDGLRLRCQLVTVPGQSVYAERRWHAIETADAIVFVTGSAPVDIAASRPLLDALRAHLALETEARVPLILQANKQDLDDAMSPVAVREALGLDASVQVVGAEASRGLGVLETAATSIREAAGVLKARLRAGDLGRLGRHVETASQLHEAMQRLALDFEPALIPRSRPPLARTPRGATLIPPPRSPRLPAPDVPSERLWPHRIARGLLERIPILVPGERDIDRGAGFKDADGTRRWVVESGMWRLETSVRERFDLIDPARRRLRELAQWQQRLGELAPPRRAYVIQVDAHGAYWLWRLGLGLPTLQMKLNEAGRLGRAEEADRWLERYAMVADEVGLLAHRAGRRVQLDPMQFGTLSDRCVYLGETESESGRSPSDSSKLNRGDG